MKKINKSPRLHCTDKEESVPELREYFDCVKKAEEKVDTAHKAIPKKKHISKKTVYNEASGKYEKHLHFEEIEKPPNEVVKPYHNSMLQHILSHEAHQKVSEAEKENSGVESFHKAEITVENLIEEGYKHVRYAQNKHRLKPYRRMKEAERELNKTKQIYQYHKNLYENPQAGSNPTKQFHKKQRMKQSIKQRMKSFPVTFNYNKKVIKQGKSFLLKHGHTIVICSITVLLFTFCIAGITACTAILSGGISSISSSTFLALEDDITGTEEDYILMESSLQEQIDNIETTYSGYDEYVYSTDRIWHDPYVLTSILTVIDPEYTRNSIQEELQNLFDKQYKMILTEKQETRYRPEERTAYYTDAEGNTYAYT